MKRVSLVCLATLASVTLALPAVGQDAVDFRRDIVPILRDRCIDCHGAKSQKAGLRLDRKADALKGSKNGPVLKPGNAGESELYRRTILPKDDVDIMPSEGEPLTKAQTDLLQAWIDQGAPWPDDLDLGAQAAAAAAKAVEAAPAGASARPVAPKPVLPDNFKPSAAEAEAIAAIGKSGVDVRPVAQNSPWRTANFRLQGDKITDTVIAPLKDLQSVIELNLATTKVTDDGLAVLRHLPHLTALHLELTGVSDAGLEHLRGLTNLVYLNLYGTPVTDAGLGHLTGLRCLQRLYLWQSKVTPDGAAKLREAMPWLDVNLGVEATPAATEKEPEKKPDETK